MDDRVLAVMRDGARTFVIAERLFTDTTTMRRRLKRMEREGKVHRDLARSAVNDIRWLPGPTTPPDPIVAMEGE